MSTKVHSAPIIQNTQPKSSLVSNSRPVTKNGLVSGKHVPLSPNMSNSQQKTNGKIVTNVTTKVNAPTQTPPQKLTITTTTTTGNDDEESFSEESQNEEEKVQNTTPQIASQGSLPQSIITSSNVNHNSQSDKESQHDELEDDSEVEHTQHQPELVEKSNDVLADDQMVISGVDDDAEVTDVRVEDTNMDENEANDDTNNPPSLVKKKVNNESNVNNKTKNGGVKKPRQKKGVETLFCTIKNKKKIPVAWRDGSLFKKGQLDPEMHRANIHKSRVHASMFVGIFVEAALQLMSSNASLISDMHGRPTISAKDVQSAIQLSGQTLF